MKQNNNIPTSFRYLSFDKRVLKNKNDDKKPNEESILIKCGKLINPINIKIQYILYFFLSIKHSTILSRGGRIRTCDPLLPKQDGLNVIFMLKNNYTFPKTTYKLFNLYEKHISNI